MVLQILQSLLYFKPILVMNLSRWQYPVRKLESTCSLFLLSSSIIFALGLLKLPTNTLSASDQKDFSRLLLLRSLPVLEFSLFDCRRKLQCFASERMVLCWRTSLGEICKNRYSLGNNILHSGF